MKVIYLRSWGTPQMSGSSQERDGKAIASLLLAAISAVIMFNLFQTTPPLLLAQQAASLSETSTGPGTAPLKLIIVVEKVYADSGRSERMSSVLVRVGSQVAVTNRNGFVEYRVSPGLFRVSLTSLVSELPSWSHNILITAKETEILIRYTEFRQAIQDVDISLDMMRGLSNIATKFKTPQSNATTASYGKPVLVFYDADYRKRVVIGGQVFDYPMERERSYMGPFLPVTLTPEGGIFSDLTQLSYLAPLVSASESYVPIFIVENVIVEKN